MGGIKYFPDWSQIQYFPSDIDLFRNIDAVKFVDCGGCDGDTVISLLENCKNVDTVVSYEPDPKNFTKLCENLKILKKYHSDTDFYAFPSGVWLENDILRFNALGQAASSIANSASTIKTDDNLSINIPVASLDDMLFAMEPNYIKMDIEGAEKEAILGCKEIIKSYKPTLAICLYHKHDDLWDIPLLIHEINPNYKMYIRVHMYFANEVVLYCVNE